MQYKFSEFVINLYSRSVSTRHVTFDVTYPASMLATKSLLTDHCGPTTAPRKQASKKDKRAWDVGKTENVRLTEMK